MQRVVAFQSHHPGCDYTPVCPGKDTHSTRGPVRGKAVGGPTTSHDTRRPPDNDKPWVKRAKQRPCADRHLGILHGGVSSATITWQTSRTCGQQGRRGVPDYQEDRAEETKPITDKWIWVRAPIQWTCILMFCVKHSKWKLAQKSTWTWAKCKTRTRMIVTRNSVWKWQRFSVRARRQKRSEDRWPPCCVGRTRGARRDRRPRCKPSLWRWTQSRASHSGTGEHRRAAEATNLWDQILQKQNTLL